MISARVLAMLLKKAYLGIAYVVTWKKLCNRYVIRLVILIF